MLDILPKGRNGCLNMYCNKKGWFSKARKRYRKMTCDACDAPATHLERWADEKSYMCELCADPVFSRRLKFRFKPGCKTLGLC